MDIHCPGFCSTLSTFFLIYVLYTLKGQHRSTSIWEGLCNYVLSQRYWETRATELQEARSFNWVIEWERERESCKSQKLQNSKVAKVKRWKSQKLSNSPPTQVVWGHTPLLQKWSEVTLPPTQWSDVTLPSYTVVWGHTPLLHSGLRSHSPPTQWSSVTLPSYTVVWCQTPLLNSDLRLHSLPTQVDWRLRPARSARTWPARSVRTWPARRERKWPARRERKWQARSSRTWPARSSKENERERDWLIP